MKISQVALQLYTLRNHCQTADDLARTLARVKDIGFHTVELAGINHLPEEDVVRALSNVGMQVCSAHLPAVELLDQPERAMDRLRRLGCSCGVYPFPHGVDLTDAAQIEVWLDRLNAVGAKFHAAGFQLLYHHHAIEFIPWQKHRLFEHLLEKIPAGNLGVELDTYWLHYGGMDVVDWCRRMSGRLSHLHLKDYVFTPANQPTFAELGAGTLPFAKIIPEADKSACQWFIVEQDECAGDPFASITQSLAYLRQHLLD